jgi:hypothetical protein
MTTFVYNFKKQFADIVACGCKRQTVRGYRKDNRRPQPGDTVRLYTGLRTAAVKLLGEGRVTYVQTIRIDSVDKTVQLNGEPIFSEDLKAFARADGFRQLDDMFVFFGLAYGPMFEGLVIHWELVS